MTEHDRRSSIGRLLRLEARRQGESIPYAVARRAAVLLARLGVKVSRPNGLGTLITGSSVHVRPLSPGAALLRRPDLADGSYFETHRTLFKQMTTEHVAELLRTYRVNCVLDVGANKGQYARSLRRAGYTGHIISFEPVPETVEQLRRAAATDPHWTVQHCALGRTDTTTSMNVVYGSMSSLLAPSEYGNKRYKRFKNIQPVEVPVRRLDGMLDRILPSEIDDPRLYLKLDTQGYDLEVFAGLGERVRDFVGMQSEVAVLRIYEGMPRLTEAIETYERAGFEITGMFPVTREETTGRVLEFDCVLARSGALAQ